MKHDYEGAERTGRALADAAWQRGELMTDDDRAALQHEARWGSDGWPIVKYGRRWAVVSHLTKDAGLFDRKHDAEQAWLIQLAKLRELYALEAQERARKEIA